MSAAVGPFIGYGADLIMSTDGGSTYASVGHVVDLETADAEVGSVQASYVQMTDPWHLKIPKLADAKQATFKLIWDPAKFATLRANVRVTNKWKVVFPDLGSTASTDVFSGFLCGMPTKLVLEEMIVTEGKIEISGKPAFTAGT